MMNRKENFSVIRASKCCAVLVMGLVLCHPTAAMASAKASTLSAGSDHETPTPETRKQVMRTFSKTPLTFVANEGQFAEPVEYLARGPGYSISLTTDETIFTLARRKPADNDAAKVSANAPSGPPQAEQIAIRMKLDGASRPSAIVPRQKQDWHTNYFIGRDRSRWRTGVPGYARVRYEEVYPGIDVEYYGNQQRLEYDFIVAPGVDPGVITLSFEGADRLSVDEDGNLILHVAGGQLVQHAPVIYQETDGKRNPVDGHYALHRDGKVGFELAAYDNTRPLIIDPVLTYATYLGGSGHDFATGIAIDSKGNAFVVGYTESGFPVTAGAYQTSNAGNFDFYILKLNAVSLNIEFATYLGGSREEIGGSIVFDSADNIYVSGLTSSLDFPVTAGAFQTASTSGFLADVFIAKMDPTGSSLIYSTYLGGSRSESIDRLGEALALDDAGWVYVTGTTSSTDFPVTENAAQPTKAGGPGTEDVFIAKLEPTLSSLAYSTYLGGSDPDSSMGIVVDSAGAAYVAGYTPSADFPVTPGAFQTSFNGGSQSGAYDAFLVKLNPSGSSIDYSTYLGGEGSDITFSLRIDSQGAVYIAGQTDSLNFPVTADAVQTSHNGRRHPDIFLVKFEPSLTDLAFSTYYGTSGRESVSDMVVDASGAAYVSGQTNSFNLQVTADAYQSAYKGGSRDGYIVQFDSTGSSILYATYLGTSNFDDDPRAMAIDQTGALHIAGFTNGQDLSVTADAIQSTYSGGIRDGFYVKFATANQPPIADAGPDQVVEASSAAGATVTLDGSTSTDLDGDPLTYTWTGPFGTASGVSPTVTVPPGVHVVTLEVSDGTASASDTVQITVQDTTPPVVTPPADITAEAENPLTAVDLGTATATDLVDGALTPTPDNAGPFAPGTHTVTWSATDASGNTGTATQTVTIRYIFQGFKAPLENDPIINAVNAGRTVPVKWSVPTPSGNYFRDTAIVAVTFEFGVTCDPSGTIVDFPDEPVSSGETELRYDDTNEQFVFNWKTSKDMAGSCHIFILLLDDGSFYLARFKLK